MTIEDRLMGGSDEDQKLADRLAVTITNPKQLSGTSQIVHDFGSNGGSLGSGPDVDWSITETGGNSAEAHHLDFAVIEGQYCLIDKSQSGTFINGASARAEPGTPIRISSGDRLRIGALKFLVELNAATSDPFLDHAQQTHELTEVTEMNPYRDIAPGSASSAPPRENPLLMGGDPFNANDRRAEPEMTSKTSDKDPLSPFPDTESEIRMESDPLLQFDRAGIALERGHNRDALLVPDVGREAAAGLGQDQRDLMGSIHASVSGDIRQELGDASMDTDAAQYLASLENSDVPIGASEFGTQDGEAAIDHVALRPLLKSLGLKIDELSAAQTEQFLSEVGMVLRETIAAMVELYQSAPGSGPVESRLNATNIMPLEDNPMRLAATVDEGVENLFFIQNPVQLSPSDAIRECFGQIKDHQRFTESSADQGLAAALRVFDPDVLSRRFHAYAQANRDRRPRDDAWHWDMYKKYYRELQAKRQDGLRRIFWQVFERAYDQSARNQPSIF